MTQVDLQTSPVPVGDIAATGTPSVSTFLRGDGAWATPAGGEGGPSELDRVTLESTGAIEFTAIPDSFTHLIIEGRLRASRSANSAEGRIQVGDGSFDTGSNYGYSFRSFLGTSLAMAADVSASHSLVSTFELPGATSPAGAFSFFRQEIFYYADTSAWRVFDTRITGFVDTNVRHVVGAGAWKNTADPIERWRIQPQDGSWLAGSELVLYGR